jgi:hypothetical protein
MRDVDGIQNIISSSVHTINILIEGDDFGYAFAVVRPEQSSENLNPAKLVSKFILGFL